MRKIQPALLGAVLFMGLWLTACAGPQMAPSTAPDDRWEAQPTVATGGARMSENRRIFYGTGAASGMRNTTLLRATADNLAQSEMAGLIDNYIKTLVREAGLSQIEDPDQEMLNALTRTILKQARVGGHQYNDADRSLVSQCSLELSTVKQVIATHPWIDAQLRKNMLTHADAVYDTLTARQR
jgi:hypothetical protein